MDMNDLAASLFNTSRIETTARTNHGETTTIYGVATQDSSDGQVSVQISNYVTKPSPTGDSKYDADLDTNTTSVLIPTSPHVKQGDTVAITCVGASAAKHPFVSAVMGSGDRIAKEIADIDVTEVSELYKKLVSEIETTTDNLEVFITKTAPETYLKKTDASNTYLTKSTAASTYATRKEYDTLNTKVNDLEKQINNSIDMFFETGEPTLDNYPANTWTTEGLKNRNRGSLYYDNDTGYGYRWNGTGWIQVADTAQTKALAELDEFRTTYATNASVTEQIAKLSDQITSNMNDLKVQNTPISNNSQDTFSTWVNIKPGTYWFGQWLLNGQPNQYGFLIHMVFGSGEVYQIFVGSGGAKCGHRGANSSVGAMETFQVIAYTSDLPTNWASTYWVNSQINDSASSTRKWVSDNYITKGTINNHITRVYRCYNPYGGDHMFTTDTGEYNDLIRAGWNGEGAKFWALTGPY